MDTKDDGTAEVVLKIRSSKDQSYTKRVAGAISWQLREKGYCKARAVKTEAINTVTKAVAVVNQRVASAGVSMSIDPIFAPVEGPTPKAPEPNGEHATALALTIEDSSEYSRPSEFLDYKVSGAENGVIAKLAGAIAGPVRQGKGIRLGCIGASSVYKAMIACTVAKGYIYPNGLKAIIVPTWETLRQEGREPVSLIRLDFWGVSSEQ